MNVIIQVTNVGELHSFEGGSPGGFIRFRVAGRGAFDLPVSKKQLEQFMGGVVRHTEGVPAPAPPSDDLGEGFLSSSSEDGPSSPAFGAGGGGFDLDDEGPLILRHRLPSFEDDEGNL